MWPWGDMELNLGMGAGEGGEDGGFEELAVDAVSEW